MNPSLLCTAQSADNVFDILESIASAFSQQMIMIMNMYFACQVKHFFLHSQGIEHF